MKETISGRGGFGNYNSIPIVTLHMWGLWRMLCMQPYLYPVKVERWFSMDPRLK